MNNGSKIAIGVAVAGTAFYFGAKYVFKAVLESMVKATVSTAVYGVCEAAAPSPKGDVAK